jgi:hypothetical protein
MKVIPETCCSHYIWYLLFYLGKCKKNEADEPIHVVSFTSSSVCILMDSNEESLDY